MKTIITYYSYTGHSKNFAEILAKQEGADILELKDSKPLSKFKAYILGSFAAMCRKPAKLQPHDVNLAEYDKIIIAMPIWAGHPAPAMNNIINSLPGGKEIELIMTSAAGNSPSREKTIALIEVKSCTVTKYEDMKL